MDWGGSSFYAGGSVSSDDASRSTCETFSSDEKDPIEFTGLSFSPGCHSKRIGANDGSLLMASVKLCSSTTLQAWLAFGRNVGRNTHLKKLRLCVKRDDGDERLSPENTRTFLEGLSGNRSLRYLELNQFDFSRFYYPNSGMDALRPFFVENENLVDLRLINCGLYVHDILRIADAVDQRSYTDSLRTIQILEANIDPELVGAIVVLAITSSFLTKLIVGYYGMDMQCWNELGILLEDEYGESMLKCLYLDRNDIDDDGVQVLANAIANNILLERLSLSWCDAITATGWGHLLRVVGDTSSIDATNQSNHALKRLWSASLSASEIMRQSGDPDDSDDPDEIIAYEVRQRLPYDLLFCLKANEDGWTDAAREKIFHFHLNGNFDLSPFHDMSLGMLSKALGWIGKDSSSESRLSEFYRILRNFPDLCKFPSRERKVRLEVEAENAKLKAEIVTLKEDIASMREQIQQLTIQNEELQANKRPKMG